MASIRRSLVLSFAQRYTSLLIGVPSIMVLARFLTPAETGIFSVALAFTNLAHMLRDFGVSDYLIQEHQLDRDKLRSAFTITGAMACLMALAIFFGAPAIARLYDQAGVGKVLRVIAVNFLLIPIGSNASSMMRRELAYGALYIRNTAESATRNFASVGLAVAGFSYMSLAWGSLAGITVGTLATVILRPRYITLLPSFRHWRAVVSFGHKMIAIDVLQQLTINSKDMVLGRTLGFAATGLYSRGAGLVNLFYRNFTSAIQSVAYPTFAQRNREGRDVSALYAKSIAYLTAIAWPLFAFAALMAHPIILAAYGSQWIAAVPVLRLIAIGAAISMLYSYSGQLLTAAGHINARLYTRVIAQPIQIGLIVAAAFYSIEAVAAVKIVMALFNIVLQYQQLHKHLGLRFSTVLRATFTSAAVTATSSVVPAAILALAVTGKLSNPWVEVIAGGAGWAVVWLISIVAFKHPLYEELQSAWARIYRRFYPRRSGT
jgi:O-antigen/teichoic acid export membrane protein